MKLGSRLGVLQSIVLTRVQNRHHHRHQQSPFCGRGRGGKSVKTSAAATPRPQPGPACSPPLVDLSHRPVCGSESGTSTCGRDTGWGLGVGGRGRGAWSRCVVVGEKLRISHNELNRRKYQPGPGNGKKATFSGFQMHNTVGSLALHCTTYSTTVFDRFYVYYEIMLLIT